jgi:hypothetical protein
MKVLKRPDTKWSMLHTCANCTAELEIEKADVKWECMPGDQRDPPYNKYFTYCTLCGEEISILEKSIPKAVQVEIRRGKSLFTTSPDYNKWTGDGPFER